MFDLIFQIPKVYHWQQNPTICGWFTDD